jgi:hypothetical protein
MYIIQYKNTIYYTFYGYDVVYIVHCRTKAHGCQCSLKTRAQHSAFILCSRLSLDNPYGTIIS